MTKLDILKTGSLSSIIGKYKTKCDFAESYNVEGAIVFVDFNKASYSLEWIFYLTTLKHLGFFNRL